MGTFDSKVKTFSDLKSGRQSLRIPILDELDASGGTMQVDLGTSSLPSSTTNRPHRGAFLCFLVNVEDATGCKRPLDTPGVAVLVKRVKVRLETPCYLSGNDVSIHLC